MSPIAEKHKNTVNEAIEHLISRAVNARGLSGADVSARVCATVEKYLLRDTPGAAHTEILDFVEEIRADDLCLIVACERGDEKAWEDLVANFDSTVKSAARKISSNNEDAEDLASSIWAELYGLRVDADGNKKSKLAYYSGRGSLAGWLRAVVSQLAVDQFRKQSKFVQIEEDREFENLANEAAGNDNNHFASHGQNPEVIFSEGQATADVSTALAAAIAGLEAEDRLILKMYYFDDLKLKDIAATFGYHEATASRKLTRVQADIRKGVEKELKSRHGWTDGEVKRHLSDTAAGLGLNLETMIAILLVMAFVQDLWTGGVL
ncbi:MAG: sigma-70 family RNA polymerase sigma factor [Pyrinomonadaceae bacterium]|nr:sigma-70 family RNA polymerase sigma factor [Pyrinomonadaceae bacterium]MBP6214439.1 sigma-70 family RNA polymerase sigma factor [Pyrinomonadaceae bacterium]